MIFLGIGLVIFFIVLIFFSFPQLSPIPYFPSNKKDAQLILQALQIKNNQCVVDLGAGDGWVTMQAATEAYRKKLNTTFIAVEINPFLLTMLHVRRLLHPNRKHITVMYGNMFTMDYGRINTGKTLTFYLYISPWYLNKTIAQINKYLKHYQVVSYLYPLPAKKPLKELVGRHKVFMYEKT